MSSENGIRYRLDDIDKRIIHALMADARTTSAPMIAEQVDVSPGTIRNRINQLGEHDIIRGYHASIDFERADQKHTYLYICSAPAEDIGTVRSTIESIPEVINVRELVSGIKNIHVLAVGETTADFRRIMQSLLNNGIRVDEKHLVQSERVLPYGPFGPAEEATPWRPTDAIHLASGAEMLEITIPEGAPITHHTLADAATDGSLDDEVLVVTIERDGHSITPHGETVIKPDDVVTILLREIDPSTALSPFRDVDGAEVDE